LQTKKKPFNILYQKIWLEQIFRIYLTTIYTISSLGNISTHILLYMLHLHIKILASVSQSMYNHHCLLLSVKQPNHKQPGKWEART